MDFNSFVTNIKLDSTSKPQLTVDEVEKIERKRVANIVGHVFQLTYAAIFHSLIQEEKVRRCNGCDIHHPSQREHSCLMMEVVIVVTGGLKGCRRRAIVLGYCSQI